MPKNSSKPAGEIVSTGVAGLDEILNGGVPKGGLYLLQGAPGTGKTTAGLQFLRAGADKGEPVLYVSLSQTRRELQQIAKSHGLSLSGIDIAEMDVRESSDGFDDQSIFSSSEMRMDRTRDRIEKLISSHSPKRIVYDSLIEVRELSAEALTYRRELLGFKKYLAGQDVTALLLDTDRGHGGDYEVEAVANGVIHFEMDLPEYGIARRRVAVKKMRGVAYADGYHDIAIRKGGVVVFPRVVSNFKPEARQARLIKSGLDELDEMLGGGLEAGTATLITGQAGTGKSTLGSLYAEAALNRGDAAALFLFEEREETFFRRCDGLGIDLRDHKKSGLLSINDFSPAEIPPGEFSVLVQKIVDENNVKVVLIDSFTGYLSALPRSNMAVLQMHSLLKYLARRGVLTILIVAQHGLLGQEASPEVDISFLGDAVILLRLFEWPGLIRRSVTVVKKRHGPHDMNLKELVIGDEGLRLQDYNPPPRGVSGPIANE